MLYIAYAILPKRLLEYIVCILHLYTLNLVNRDRLVERSSFSFLIGSSRSQLLLRFLKNIFYYHALLIYVGCTRFSIKRTHIFMQEKNGKIVRLVLGLANNFGHLLFNILGTWIGKCKILGTCPGKWVYKWLSVSKEKMKRAKSDSLMIDVSSLWGLQLSYYQLPSIMEQTIFLSLELHATISLWDSERRYKGENRICNCLNKEGRHQ